VVEFLAYNPDVLLYNVITSVVSTTGQLAIYYTIKRFGPVVFTVIMTTRQMFSIVLSNHLFGHNMAAQAYLGAALVFLVLLYSAYRQLPSSSAAAAAAAPSSAPTAPSSSEAAEDGNSAVASADADSDNIEAGKENVLKK
jgi:hypothetical protein